MILKHQDLAGIIVGPLKVVGPTNAKNAGNCRVWAAECTCRAKEYGSRSELERYAGFIACPGHPFAGKEKILDGFKLVPELRGTPEQCAAAVAWETARAGKGHEEPDAEVPKLEKDEESSAGSAMLAKRLGLHGYKLETMHLPTPLLVQNITINKAVFAIALTGDDRVFLHIEGIGADADGDAGGKRTMISSRKKMTDHEWSALGAAFAELKLQWREKETKKMT